MEWTIWAGFAAGLLISTVTAPVGVSGAVFPLPVQLSILGVPSPAATPTNLLFNVVAGPGPLWRYRRDGALCGTPARRLVAWTLPGVIAGGAIRVFALPGPDVLRFLVAAFLLPLGAWLCLRTLCPVRRRPDADRTVGARTRRPRPDGRCGRRDLRDRRRFPARADPRRARHAHGPHRAGHPRRHLHDLRCRGRRVRRAGRGEFRARRAPTGGWVWPVASAVCSAATSGAVFSLACPRPSSACCWARSRPSYASSSCAGTRPPSPHRRRPGRPEASGPSHIACCGSRSGPRPWRKPGRPAAGHPPQEAPVPARRDRRLSCRHRLGPWARDSPGLGLTVSLVRR